MKKYVFDACSLIYLTKINIKEMLPKLGDLIISSTVKNELIEDIERFKDAKALKKNIAKKIIKETDYRIQDLFSTKNLGKGEKSTIEICLKNEWILVTDDHQALNLAISVGLQPKTSEIILLDLLKRSIIDYEKFNTLFGELAVIKVLKPEIIIFFNKKAEEINKTKNNKSMEENK